MNLIGLRFFTVFFLLYKKKGLEKDMILVATKAASFFYSLLYLIILYQTFDFQTKYMVFHFMSAIEHILVSEIFSLLVILKDRCKNFKRS